MLDGSVLDTGDASMDSSTLARCDVDIDRRYPAMLTHATDFEAMSDGFVLGGWGIEGAWILRSERDGTPTRESWIRGGTALESLAVQGDRVTFSGWVQLISHYDGWIGQDDGAEASTLLATGQSGDDQLFRIVAAPSGGYLAVGATGTVPSAWEGFNQVWWMVRTDASGATMWSRTYPSSTRAFDQALDAEPLSDGGFAVVGTSYGDVRVMIIDEGGAPRLDRIYDLEGWDGARAVSVLSNGDIVVSGFGGIAGWVARMGLDGSIAWQRLFPVTTEGLDLNALTVLPGDLVAVAGSAYMGGSGENGVHVWLLDANGAILIDDARFGTSERVQDAAPTADGFALFGDFDSLRDTTGITNAWLRSFRCVKDPI